MQLTIFGLLFQLLYIGFRFGGAAWGVAATVAVFHDVLVTLGLLAIFRYEITLNVIAALLTLVGYSVNDTIVIFDRVRENLKQRRKDSLPKIINDSVNQTLSRTSSPTARPSCPSSACTFSGARFSAGSASRWRSDHRRTIDDFIACRCYWWEASGRAEARAPEPPYRVVGNGRGRLA